MQPIFRIVTILDEGSNEGKGLMISPKFSAKMRAKRFLDKKNKPIQSKHLRCQIQNTDSVLGLGISQHLSWLKTAWKGNRALNFQVLYSRYVSLNMAHGKCRTRPWMTPQKKFPEEAFLGRCVGGWHFLVNEGKHQQQKWNKWCMGAVVHNQPWLTYLTHQLILVSIWTCRQWLRYQSFKMWYDCPWEVLQGNLNRTTSATPPFSYSLWCLGKPSHDQGPQPSNVTSDPRPQKVFKWWWGTLPPIIMEAGKWVYLQQ